MHFSLYIMSQWSLQNVTAHPASHNTRTPISNAIYKLGMICPVSTIGNPGIVISQPWVDFIFVPSGRLMVSGFVARRLLFTGVTSMMKMAVAPVSTIACDVAIVISCRRLCPGAPNRVRAVAANVHC